MQVVLIKLGVSLKKKKKKTRGELIERKGCRGS